MAKIKVEIEVPENCKDCMMFNGEYRYCDLFDNYIIYDVYENSFKRCDECKQSEVKDD